MPFTLKDLLLGFMMPAILTGIVGHFIFRYRKLSDLVMIWMWPLLLVLSFQLSYRCLNLGPVYPKSSWHWLPYVICLGAVLCATTIKANLPRYLRWGLQLVIIGLSAWLLVPLWESLRPWRSAYLLFWTAYVTLLIQMTINGCQRTSIRLQFILTGTACMAGMILLLASGNLRFAHMLLICMGILMGVWVSSPIASSQTGPWVTGVVTSYVILLAALMLVGHLNSTAKIPAALYAIIPAMPLLAGCLLRLKLPASTAVPTTFTGSKLPADQADAVPRVD